MLRLILAALLGVGSLSAAGAQETSGAPSFWDPQRHLARPDPGALRLIRFLTEDDAPPFHFALPDGGLTGFDVEIARAACEELKIPCTIQARRADTLVDALVGGQGDAVLAEVAPTAENRLRLDFTAPYHKSPARFVALRPVKLADPVPETLAGRTVGAVAASAYAAFLRDFFPKTDVRRFESRDNLLSALKRGEVDLAFDDGVALSFWLNGADSGDCCAFVGGPYLENRYFGEGAKIAVRKDNDTLRLALDYALRRVHESGAYANLYLKYFPVNFWGDGR